MTIQNSQRALGLEKLNGYPVSKKGTEHSKRTGYLSLTEEHKPLHSASTPPGSEGGCTDWRPMFQSVGIRKEQKWQQQQEGKAQAEKNLEAAQN